MNRPMSKGAEIILKDLLSKLENEEIEVTSIKAGKSKANFSGTSYPADDDGFILVMKFKARATSDC